MQNLQRIWSYPEVLSPPVGTVIGFSAAPATIGRVTDVANPVEALERPKVVGRCPEVEVIIQGKKIPCVLDTGSQVTMFGQSFFQRHFGGEGLRDAGELQWLTLNAANGLQIPFVGYAVLDFSIGGIEVPERGVVIVTDDCIGSDYGLLGMNVISECWEGLSQKGHPGHEAFKSTLPPSAHRVWEKAFNLCQKTHDTPLADAPSGTARL